MRLTKAMREAFVLAVVADISTKPDNDAIRKRVMAEALDALPTEVRALLANPDLANYIHRGYVNFDSLKRTRQRENWRTDGICVDAVVVPCNPGWKPGAKTQAWVKTLQLDAEQRLDAKDDLKLQLTAMANKCMTREALVTLLPNLERYMPAPPPEGMTYPVTTGSVGDMMKTLSKLGVPAPKKVAVAA